MMNKLRVMILDGLFALASLPIKAELDYEHYARSKRYGVGCDCGHVTEVIASVRLWPEELNSSKSATSLCMTMR